MGRTPRKLALALAALWLAAPASALGAPVEIAEAVRALEGDHDRALAAVYRLRNAGAPAARQLQRVWPTLSLVAQRRAVSALSELARAHDAAVDALVLAARSEDADLQDAALAALGKAMPRARRGLVALLADPNVGDRAATSLARAAPGPAIQPLLDAIADGGADRPGLRRALGSAVQRSNETAAQRLRAWLDDAPPPDAVGSAALGLAPLGTHAWIVAAFIEYAAPRSADFETAWRLLESAPGAAPSVAIDAWVERQLKEPESWMLRSAAVDAITARGKRERARPSLDDPHPRVRMRAAAALSGDRPTMTARATLARRDTWPMVRAEAVRSLRTEAAAMPVVIAAVDDSMSEVRAVAIAVLAGSTHDEGWPRVHRRLRDEREWPYVTEAAIDYVVAHCRTDAVDALMRLVMRATPSNALTEDLNNAALAIEALRALGTGDARGAVQQLQATEGVPPTLKMALERPLPEGGGCARAAR